MQQSSLIDDENSPILENNGDKSSVTEVQDIPIGLNIVIDSCFDESLKKKKKLHHDFDEQLFLEESAIDEKLACDLNQIDCTSGCEIQTKDFFFENFDVEITFCDMPQKLKKFCKQVVRFFVNVHSTGDNLILESQTDTFCRDITDELISK